MGRKEMMTVENKLLKELYDYFYVRPELDEQMCIRDRLYTESQVGDLLDELDVLRDLIGRTNDDARSASNEISERMQAI